MADVTVDFDTLKKELSSALDSTLKAELAGLELRLFKGFQDALAAKADNAVVDEHDKRLRALEDSRTARGHLEGDVLDLVKRVSALEKFRYAIPSVAFFSFIVSLILLFYYITRVH